MVEDLREQRETRELVRIDINERDKKTRSQYDITNLELTDFRLENH
jgi:hypothetical protein